MSRSSRAHATIFAPRSRNFQGPFGRIFRHLDPWLPAESDEQKAESAIRSFARRQMAETPRQANGLLDNRNLPAGYTYFGQFVDHDITFDPTSSLQRRNDPSKLHNFRTPRLDLDCLYGEGPDDEPFMYDKDRQGMFLLGTVNGSNEPDLPRNSQGRALIGDMRNDENTIVSQFQLAMLRLHNRVFAEVRGVPDDGKPYPALPGEEFAALFDEAQRIVRWFYQYVVWNDFVKRLVAEQIWAETLEPKRGRLRFNGRFYKWRHHPFIPVEFAVSAYRFGHSLIRPGYQINVNNNVGLGFGTELPIFADPPNSTQDLSGFRPLPARHTLQWDWFFDISSGGPFPQASRRIDRKLSSSVSAIPDGAGGTNRLASLNMLRSWRMEMPTGTGVARAMGFTPHDVSGDVHDNILWVYILTEASLLPGVDAGRMLGDVGGTIVAEVFGGLLAGDPAGYVRNAPMWQPGQEPAINTLLPQGPENGTDWEVADLIRASGAPVDDQDVASTIATGRNP